MADEYSITPDKDPSLSPSERIGQLTALAKTNAWTHEIVPRLRLMIDDHIAAAIAPDKTPQARAEHVQAIHSLRQVITMPQDAAAAIASARKLKQTSERHAP